MLLAILLPVQGVALVLDQAWRPAHYHRHVSVPIGPASAPGLLRDDTVLAYLPDGPDAQAMAPAHPRCLRSTTASAITCTPSTTPTSSTSTTTGSRANRPGISPTAW